MPTVDELNTAITAVSDKLTDVSEEVAKIGSDLTAFIDSHQGDIPQEALDQLKIVGDRLDAVGTSLTAIDDALPEQ